MEFKARVLHYEPDALAIKDEMAEEWDIYDTKFEEVIIGTGNTEEEAWEDAYDAIIDHKEFPDEDEDSEDEEEDED